VIKSATTETAVGQLVENHLHAAFAIDKNHVITYWNKHLEGLTGVPASERIGTNLQWSPFYNNKRRILADP
jgi:PAS domain-containing protein